MRLPAFHFWSTLCEPSVERTLALTEWEEAVLALPYFGTRDAKTWTSAVCYSVLADRPTEEVWQQRRSSLDAFVRDLDGCGEDLSAAERVTRAFLDATLVPGDAAEYDRDVLIAGLGERTAALRAAVRDRRAARTTLERLIEGSDAGAIARRLHRSGFLRDTRPSALAELTASIASGRAGRPVRTVPHWKDRSTGPWDPLVDELLWALNDLGVAAAYESPSRSPVRVWWDALRTRGRRGRAGRHRDEDFVRGLMLEALRRDRSGFATPPAVGQSRTHRFGEFSVTVSTDAAPSGGGEVHRVQCDAYGEWLAGCSVGRELDLEPVYLPQADGHE